jgi:UrcA family protein
MNFPSQAGPTFNTGVRKMTYFRPVISLIALAGLTAATAANAADNPENTVKVKYSDLDLTSNNGFRLLDRRIGRAIERVCGSYAEVHDMVDAQKIDRCRVSAQQHIGPQLAQLRDHVKVRLSSAVTLPRQP